jgi:hypothetical protein
MAMYVVFILVAEWIFKHYVDKLRIQTAFSLFYNINCCCCRPCRLGEAMSLNCGHQCAYCLSSR